MAVTLISSSLRSGVPGRDSTGAPSGRSGRPPFSNSLPYGRCGRTDSCLFPSWGHIFLLLFLNNLIAPRRKSQRDFGKDTYRHTCLRQNRNSIRHQTKLSQKIICDGWIPVIIATRLMAVRQVLGWSFWTRRRARALRPSTYSLLRCASTRMRVN